MLKTKRWLALTLTGLVLALVAGAALQASLNYKPLARPQPTETGAKIEVVEFFWYGCNHCFDLEPFLKTWSAKLPKDVEFRRIPAIPTERWAPEARIYYTLETLGEVKRLHGEVFGAIHLDRVNLNDEKTLFNWMATKGVDRKKFVDAWTSFTVQSKTKRAVSLSQAFDITSVPSLVVEGKYLTSVFMTGSQERLMDTLDELIVKARGERKE